MYFKETEKNLDYVFSKVTALRKGNRDICPLTLNKDSRGTPHLSFAFVPTASYPHQSLSCRRVGLCLSFIIYKANVLI